MSPDGFDNESRIAEYLNCKTFSELNSNMKRFVRYLNENEDLDGDTHIVSDALRGLKKADLVVKFNNISKFISVKKGSGNSVHQEKIEFFLEFIDGLGASEEVKMYLQEFIDSFEDGNVFFASCPEKKTAIQQFFNEHMRTLLIRFLKTGRFTGDHAEYIYHGTISDGKFRKIDEAIECMTLNRSIGSAQLYVGCLTFQKWNTRNVAKRGSIQLKWPNIRNFLI